MVMRSVVGAVFLAALGVAACGEFTSPASTGADEVNANRGAKEDDNAEARDRKGTDTPARADGGSATSGDGGKVSKQPVPLPPADAECVTRCKGAVEAKCEAEGDFCSLTCGSTNLAFITCMESAPSCDKPEWIRCRQESGTDDGGEK
jgi:hypothetical protein